MLSVLHLQSLSATLKAGVQKVQNVIGFMKKTKSGSTSTDESTDGQ